jgi:hypothetical protein
LDFSVRDLEHHRDKPAAARDFQFAKDRVKMLFHHLQAQAGVIGNLLVTPPFADKSREFLLAPGKPGQSWQMGVSRSVGSGAVSIQIFTLDNKMWPRHARGFEVSQMDGCSQMWQSRMMDTLLLETGLQP